MALSSSQLEAFAALAVTQHFSQAAKNLSITQSALSQRIGNLEDELGVTLFIRGPAGARLTATGEKLLRYTKIKSHLEQEFVSSLKSGKGEAFSGVLRIASFSSVTRSLVIPALADFLKKNPDVQVEIISREISELMGLLKRGEADYILSLEEPHSKKDLECIYLGEEKSVLVQAAHGDVIDQYLDHDLQDSTTESFFKQQKKGPRHWRRSYFDEIYGIIDAVRLGIGKAVLPLHLIGDDKSLMVVKGYEAVGVPIYLIFHAQPFYTKMHEKVVEVLKKGF